MSEIRHYGILGMRWGRRKAQTPNSSDHDQYSSIRKKKLRNMTDDEVRIIAKRMKLIHDLKSSKFVSGKKISKMSNQDLTNAINRQRLKKEQWEKGFGAGKRIDKMSDAEVKRAIQRLNLEKPIKDLQKQSFQESLKKVAVIVSALSIASSLS